ncbi:hypothetical protein [Niallia sp. FSL W8-0635]|uniref:hypothetical protein n=1 Tax=Niallia sp. FSL W8-0635 TaxID=2975337 RepID=UPI0030FC540F
MKERGENRRALWESGVRVKGMKAENRRASTKSGVHQPDENQNRESTNKKWCS